MVEEGKETETSFQSMENENAPTTGPAI